MPAVLVRLGVGDGERHVSTLSSVRTMLERVYPSLEEGEEGEERFSPLTAAGLVVGLVEPFTAHIHHQFTSSLVSQSPLPTLCWISLGVCRLHCRPSGLLSRESVSDCESPPLQLRSLIATSLTPDC